VAPGVGALGVESTLLERSTRSLKLSAPGPSRHIEALDRRYRLGELTPPDDNQLERPAGMVRSFGSRAEYFDRREVPC
jgi:hypothetical protein